jgi:hypothetical protein
MSLLRRIRGEGGGGEEDPIQRKIREAEKMREEQKRRFEEMDPKERKAWVREDSIEAQQEKDREELSDPFDNEN